VLELVMFLGVGTETGEIWAMARSELRICVS